MALSSLKFIFLIKKYNIKMWPPDFLIKKHPLAKRVTLTITAQHGLKLIVPAAFNTKNIPKILEQHQAWILKHLKEKPPVKLPTNIYFPALDLTFTLHKIACNQKLQMMVNLKHEIFFIGQVNHDELCRKKLLCWLKNIAKDYLSQQLAMLSHKTQLTYQKLTIRDQQTLWGSCTRHQAISLNYKMIFLPEKLVHHIMIHELCHTKYLNHSKQFWQQVALFDANWREHKKELRLAQQYIPDWVR